MTKMKNFFFFETENNNLGDASELFWVNETEYLEQCGSYHFSNIKTI